MILEFDRMETTCLEHFQGREKCLKTKMQVDELNKIMRGMLEPGASVGLLTPRDQQRDHLYPEGNRKSPL